MKPDKNFKDKPCIYKITNKIDGKIYVGKTKCIIKRSYGYNSSFRSERHDHINDYLFNAMTKYGYENFKIEPIEFCNIEKLAERELFWIDALKSNERCVGYNLRLDSSTGMIASIETIEKIKFNITEQWANGVRDKHGEKLKQAWARDPIRRDQMSGYFSKLLTKHLYIVTDLWGITKICNYKELYDLKLHRVLSSFWRKNTTKLLFKSHIIEKIKL